MLIGEYMDFQTTYSSDLLANEVQSAIMINLNI